MRMMAVMIVFAVHMHSFGMMVFAHDVLESAIQEGRVTRGLRHARPSSDFLNDRTTAGLPYNDG